MKTLSLSHDDLEKLFWLAAHDYVFFSTYNPVTEGWDNGWYGYLNVNDTFHYATCEGEEFPIEDLPTITKLAEQYGWDGIVAYAAIKRNMDPIKPLITTKYLEARHELEALQCDSSS